MLKYNMNWRAVGPSIIRLAKIGRSNYITGAIECENLWGKVLVFNRIFNGQMN